LTRLVLFPTLLFIPPVEPLLDQDEGGINIKFCLYKGFIRSGRIS
jgi:hypothetical protein